jgi:hypothetical protein
MAQHTFMENVHRNTEDWFAVKEAVRSKRVDCSDDTPTADVARKIAEIDESNKTQLKALIEKSIGGYETFVIPYGTTKIADYAFYYFYSVYYVDIPNTVTSIGQHAFAVCQNLRNITIPNSVTAIGTYAFDGCDKLESITIPDSVTAIGATAFENCYQLTNIVLPNNLTRIGDSLFSGCSRLASIVIPKKVTKIGYNAFHGCNSLTDIYYTGTQAQWESITGLSDAGIPAGATIHYEYTPV